MDIQESWEKAVKHTKIIRSRARDLMTFEATDVPYIFLAESKINPGDTVVRKGEIRVEKPAIILPSNLPQFEGFDFETDFHLTQDTVLNFFLVRGITFPSLKYNNKTNQLDIYEASLDKAIEYHADKLQREENVITGLVTGPEDCWQFSILLFIITQIVRSAETDVRRLLEDFRKRFGP